MLILKCFLSTPVSGWTGCGIEKGIHPTEPQSSVGSFTQESLKKKKEIVPEKCED